MGALGKIVRHDESLHDALRDVTHALVVAVLVLHGVDVAVDDDPASSWQKSL